MPEWAEDDPGAYWEAADERRELAVEFAERVCSQERLPYTLAIHRGGANREKPHAHLMFSERGHDGIERDAEQWFRRYNRKAQEKGGARKSRAAKAGDWLEKTRKAWEQTRTGRWSGRAGPSGSTSTAWPSYGTRRSDPETWNGRRRRSNKRGASSEGTERANTSARRTANRWSGWSARSPGSRRG